MCIFSTLYVHTGTPIPSFRPSNESEVSFNVVFIGRDFSGDLAHKTHQWHFSESKHFKISFSLLIVSSGLCLMCDREDVD